MDEQSTQTPPPPIVDGQQKLSPRGAIVVGILFILCGAAIALIGLRVIPADPASFEAPHWMVTCAGIIFILGGAAVINGYVFGKGINPDGTFGQGTSSKVKLIQNTLGSAIIGVMALMTGWISFGPGERHFIITVPFLGKIPGGEKGGRIAFGICCAILLVFFIYSIKNIFKKNSLEQTSPSDSSGT